jgi:hypothetical protein
MAEGNGNGDRIHLLGDHKPKANRKQTDAFGRVLVHNATVEDVYQIVAGETAKVHDFYLQQIPPFVAKMIQDALMSYGLIQLTPDAKLAATPPEGEQPAPAEAATDVGDTQADEAAP